MSRMIASKEAEPDDPRHAPSARGGATCEEPAEAAGLFSTFDNPTRDEDLDIDRSRFSGVTSCTTATTLLAGDDCTSTREDPLTDGMAGDSSRIKPYKQCTIGPSNTSR